MIRLSALCLAFSLTALAAPLPAAVSTAPGTAATSAGSYHLRPEDVIGMSMREQDDIDLLRLHLQSLKAGLKLTRARREGTGSGIEQNQFAINIRQNRTVWNRNDSRVLIHERSCSVGRQYCFARVIKSAVRYFSYRETHTAAALGLLTLAAYSRTVLCFIGIDRSASDVFMRHP